jgi:hypothetical protein
MLTGMILFRPPPDDTLSVQEGQLVMMVNLLGEILKEMIKEGKNASKYLNRHGISNGIGAYTLGHFRNYSDVVPHGSSIRRLLEIRKERSNYHIDISAEEMAIVEDLLLHMWEISPKKRATAKNLLQHRWFQPLDS